MATYQGIPIAEMMAIGQSIKIKRTDGRVHAAVISKMNENPKSVTVEWYERGETKGKEIEIEAIVLLNPELLPNYREPAVTAPEPKKLATTVVAIGAGQLNLSRNPTQSALSGGSGIGVGVGGRQIGSGSSSTGRYTMHGTSSNTGTATLSEASSVMLPPSTAPPGSAGASNTGTTGILRPRQTNIHSASSSSSRLATALSAATSAASQMQQASNFNGTTTSAMATGTATAINSTQNVATSAPASSTTGSAAASNNANAGGVRRSYVVKEVERLKENREKRRARQAVIKEEKNALMNQDPGNPNWETAQMIREYQSTLDFHPLIDGQAVEDHQITVCVRKRPMSNKESQRKDIDVISVPRKDMLIVHEPRSKVDLTKFLENHKFRFDYAFNDRCDNAVVYKYTAKPLVKTIFEGGMATCFAYGQTGSGKTHTMGGEFNGKVQDCKNGIYAMAAKDVFATLNMPRYRSMNLVVSASFFEIYSGKVFDLLSDKQKLRVLEDGKQQVQVVGLTEKVVDSVEEVLKLIQLGNTARTSGQTSANANSSRSHAVFQIVLRPRGSSKVHGKFSFIDLAGNERGADTSSANRQTRMEGAEINKSLLALKECIRALGRQSSHLPFRVSKLTQVLRDSFIGEKSKTCMIAMISPGLSSCEHTLNTLRYADRVKELVVKEAPEVLHEEEEEIINVDEDIDYDEDDDAAYNMQQEVMPPAPSRRSMPQQQHQQQQQNNNNNNNNKNGEMGDIDVLLRSLSEHDMSDELLVQHAAISDLQQTEEMVVDQHRSANDFLAQFVAESNRLYDQTNYMDYDQEAYCKHGETIFAQLVDIAVTCRDMMAEFRTKLAKEEMLSCNVKPPGSKR